ncbi:PPE family protein, partial [Mycobacterium kiyosense]
MDFARLPPELNSRQMLAGAGPGPMLAAATAWRGLAAELGSSARSFSALTSALAASSWQGSAAAAMLTAAAPYSKWLSSAAEQAEQAATQAQLAAAAFEAAQTATVHPAAISANRSRLIGLVMSNVLGQNWPAIAAVETEYEQMWAQDVATMFGYHAESSAIASTITQFRRFYAGPVTPNNQSPAAAAGDPFPRFRSAINNLATKLGSVNVGSVDIGLGNIGDFNFGIGNIGDFNFGIGNIGSQNLGSANIGNTNIGSGNIGSSNLGLGNDGFGNLGLGSLGNANIGSGNFGSLNHGLWNSGTGNIG